MEMTLFQNVPFSALAKKSTHLTKAIDDLEHGKGWVVSVPNELILASCNNKIQGTNVLTIFTPSGCSVRNCLRILST